MGPHPPRVRCFDDLDELPELTARVFDATRRFSPFLSLPWFRNFLRTVRGPRDGVRIYVAGGGADGNLPAAILPMWLPPAPARPIPIRSLKGLGNYYTGLFAPLVDYDDPRAGDAMVALTEAVAAPGGAWDLVKLSPLDPEGAPYRCMLEGFRRAGWRTQAYFRSGNWYLPSKGLDFDAYLSARSSKLRNTLARRRKKFDQAPGSVIDVVSTEDGFERALAAYQAVYSKSWQDPEPYPEFIPGLARACLREGWLRLGVAWVGGEAAAAQLWIVANGVAHIYKLAYAPEHRDLSPGTLLTARLMQHVLDVDRVEEVDYLSGDDTYKSEWMTERRERWGILAFNPSTMRGRLMAARHIGGDRLKRFLPGKR